MEFLFAMTLAGGAMFLLQRVTSRQSSPDSVTAEGMFAVGTPFKNGTARPFHDITLNKSGFVLHDAAGDTLHSVRFGDVRQVSAVRLENGLAGITLHQEIGSCWQLLNLQLKQSDMALIAGALRHILPPERLNLNGKLPDPAVPVPARLVTESLQGDVTPEADVALYAVPPLLVVLKEERIVAKLDMRSIRRVLAVERSGGGRMDALLNRAAPEGLIRLYSLHETAVFALSAYQEMAQAIAQVAGCTVEFISRDEKTKNK